MRHSPFKTIVHVHSCDASQKPTGVVRLRSGSRNAPLPFARASGDIIGVERTPSGHVVDVKLTGRRVVVKGLLFADCEPSSSTVASVQYIHSYDRAVQGMDGTGPVVELVANRFTNFHDAPQLCVSPDLARHAKGCRFTASAFDQPDFDAELARCRRHLANAARHLDAARWAGSRRDALKLWRAAQAQLERCLRRRDAADKVTHNVT